MKTTAILIAIAAIIFCLSCAISCWVPDRLTCATVATGFWLALCPAVAALVIAGYNAEVKK